MKYCLGLFLLFTQLAAADCYVTKDYKGHSVRSYNNFESTKDGFSGQSFQIHLDGDESKVVNSMGSIDDMSCFQSGANTLFCVASESGENQALIETWAVYPNSGKAVHTKTTSGYLGDGGNLMTGNIVGRCE